MVSHLHTNGNSIYLPVASTSAMFSTTNSIVVVSNSQKQSVSDAFQNVVLPPSAAPTSYKVAQRELASAKLQKKEIRDKGKEKKNGFVFFVYNFHL